MLFLPAKCVCACTHTHAHSFVGKLMLWILCPGEWGALQRIKLLEILSVVACEPCPFPPMLRPLLSFQMISKPPISVYLEEVASPPTRGLFSRAPFSTAGLPAPPAAILIPSAKAARNEEGRGKTWVVAGGRAWGRAGPLLAPA